MPGTMLAMWSPDTTTVRCASRPAPGFTTVTSPSASIAWPGTASVGERNDHTNRPMPTTARPTSARTPPSRIRTARRTRGSAAQDVAGQRPAVPPVLEHDLAVHHGRHVALGADHVATRAAREIVHEPRPRAAQ